MDSAQLCSIAAGGALGAYSRFRLAAFCASLFGTQFPWGTLCVNILGSFLAGMLAGVISPGWTSALWLDMLSKGYLGALTSFSTFSLDTLKAFAAGKTLQGVANMVLSPVLCLAGTAAGFFLARQA